VNVLFHTSAAIGIIAIVVKENKSDSIFSSNSIKQGLLSFVLGVTSHGVLDVIPHCYPFNSKLDAIASFLIMASIIFFIKNKYRFAVGMAFVGCFFPDLVDLSPQILNKYLGLNLPKLANLFPFHKHEYSGSIYNGDCNYSVIYQVITVFVVALICYFNKVKLMKLFTS